jgi:hypothetical protein
MKRFIYIVLTILIVSSLALADNQTKYSKNHWNIFTKNLVVALKSDHDGLKQAAMIHIIRYKDKLNVSKTIFPLVDIFQKHPNEKFRELATAALHYTDNKWAEDYLRKNYAEEKNPQIKRIIVSCLQAENNEEKFSFLEEELKVLLASMN